MRLKYPSLLYLGLLCLLIPIGVSLIWKNGFRSYLMNPSSFPTAQGTIKKSEVVRYSDTYGYSIEYSYSVNSQSYHSSQVTLSGKTNDDRSWALEYTLKYPVGKSVKVFYKPDEPTFAVLEPNSRNGVLPAFAVSLLFTLISLGLIRLSFARRSE